MRAMSVLLPAFGVAYAALAIWFLVRIANRRESWVMAIVILATAGALGSVVLAGAMLWLKGC